jgi:hypothetical protein
VGKRYRLLNFYALCDQGFKHHSRHFSFLLAVGSVEQGEETLLLKRILKVKEENVKMGGRPFHSSGG